MSRLSFTYADGTVYVQRPGSLFGRVKVEPDQGVFSGNTVVARAQQDEYPPKGRNKGSTIPFNVDWFHYLDNFHTKAASGWLWTPHMVWYNRGFVGDSRGSLAVNGADPYPVLECIVFPTNVVRIIDQTETHYEIFAMPTDQRPSSYDPAVFNFKHFPWIFALAQACSVNGNMQKVGTGYDVYHMNVRKPNNRSFMHKGDVELFVPAPFKASDGISTWDIIDYMLVGVEVFGITATGLRIPLLVVQNGKYVFPTNWRCALSNLPVPPDKNKFF